MGSFNQPHLEHFSFVAGRFGMEIELPVEGIAHVPHLLCASVHAARCHVVRRYGISIVPSVVVDGVGIRTWIFAFSATSRLHMRVMAVGRGGSGGAGRAGGATIESCLAMDFGAKGQTEQQNHASSLFVRGSRKGKRKREVAMRHA